MGPAQRQSALTISSTEGLYGGRARCCGAVIQQLRLTQRRAASSHMQHILRVFMCFGVLTFCSRSTRALLRLFYDCGGIGHLLRSGLGTGTDRRPVRRAGPVLMQWWRRWVRRRASQLWWTTLPAPHAMQWHQRAAPSCCVHSPLCTTLWNNTAPPVNDVRHVICCLPLKLCARRSSVMELW